VVRKASASDRIFPSGAGGATRNQAGHSQIQALTLSRPLSILWDERETVGRREKGVLALADGLLYYRMEAGVMCLIEPNPKQYTERRRFQQPDRTRLPAWSHPVVANGKLYLRDQDLLLCYDVQAK
jgi:hypothetical protein